MKRTMIGGQAVMEGVMMKNLDNYAVAVRKPDHEIEIMQGEYVSLTKRHAFCRRTPDRQPRQCAAGLH